MYKCKMTAYEGKEKYIFVSYAHKDSDKVLPVLDAMAEQGYRIWYDAGIAPGSEWPEFIAQHLNDCEVVIAFVSPNSIASPNCRREVTFALSKRKNFLGIILEPTEMSLGMEMQLSAQQCIMKHSYDTEQQFYKKIFSMPELESCRTTEEEKVVPAVSAAAVSATTAVTAAPAQKTVSDAKPATGKPSKNAMLYGGIGVGALVLILLIVLLARGCGGADEKPTDVPTKAEVTETTQAEVKPTETEPAVTKPAETKPVETEPTEAATETVQPTEAVTEEETDDGLDYVKIAGSQIPKDTTSLMGSDVILSQEDINKIAKLTKLDLVRLSNVNFSETDLSELSSLTKITELSLRDCTGLSDMTFIKNMPNIRHVFLINCGITDDMLDFEGCDSLFQLELAGNEGVTKLPKCNISYLSTLDISDTGITDLSALADAEKLIHLTAKNCQITNIDALASLKKLSRLDLSGCQIKTVTKDFHSLEMSELNFANNGATDISGFQYMSRLTKVDLSGNELTKAECVVASKDYLKEVNISGNPLEEGALDGLKGCYSLTRLEANGVPMKNLNFLEGTNKLTYLSVGNCGLTDISGVVGNKELTNLTLYSNQLTSLDFFDKLTKAKIDRLDLSGNQISDFSKLPVGRYNLLSIQGNPVDFTTFPNGKELLGSMFILTYQEDILKMPGIEELGFSVKYILNCPLGEQLAVKSGVKSRVMFGNDEVLLKNWTEYGSNYNNWKEE